MTVYRRGLSGFRDVINDIADVCPEWRQPTHVDQAVVLAAINISSRVFTSAAGDNLTDQLEILIVHVASSLVEIAVYFFRGRTEGGDPPRIMELVATSTSM